MLTPARRSPHDELCTVDDAAEHLSVHRKTVLRFIRAGRLPATKIGKGYRIRRADLDAFAGTPPVELPIADGARVTSIVDVPSVGPALASTLGRAVTNALHSGRDRRGDVHAEVVYDAELGLLKIIVVGAIAETRNLLDLVQVWLEQLTADPAP